MDTEKDSQRYIFKSCLFTFSIEQKILNFFSGNEWKGPPQFENKDGDLMMLSTDLALVEDPGFKVWAEKYYKGIFQLFVYTFLKKILIKK